MFEKLIRFSIEQRWLVLLAALGMAALGVFSYQKLPIDAVPDITNVQVQINTQAAGYSPLETEQRVTYPHWRRSWLACQTWSRPGRFRGTVCRR